MKANNRSVPKWLAVPISIYSWIAAILMTVVISLSSIILVLPFSILFDQGTRRLLHGVAVTWAQILIKSNPLWRLSVEGIENIPPGKKFVIVANHQSLLDILVVLATLPPHFKFMAKQELFNIPFIGWHMALAGYISILRKSQDSGRQAVLKAREWLRKGVSVLMFPEGTRSPDGEIQAFKLGAFKVARDEKVDLLPVVIHGTGDAVPKKSLILKKNSRLTVVIGKPVSISNQGDDAVVQVRDQIRSDMIRKLNQIRKSTS